MNIVHVTHPYIPDMGYQENCLPREQQKMGHNVTILTSTILPDDRGGSKSFEPGEYNYNGVRTKRLPSLIQLSTTGDVFLSGLFKNLINESPDIIHSHGILSPYISTCALYSYITSTPLVVDDHIDDDNFSLNAIKNRSLFAIFKNLLLPIFSKSVDKFLPIQGFSRDILVDALDIPQDRVDILPLGVDTDEFHPNESIGKGIREEINIEPSQFLLITSGHLEPGKRIEILIKSAQKLICDGYPIHLLILGPGPENYINELKSIARECGILNRVTFYGYVEHHRLNKFFNAADIGVWPGIGISINEAIGTGLPVIIGENRSTEHLVEYGNGFTFNNQNPDDLYQLLRRYLDSPSLIESHSEAAQVYVDERLSWEAIAEQSIEIYSSALQDA